MEREVNSRDFYRIYKVFLDKNYSQMLVMDWNNNIHKEWPYQQNFDNLFSLKYILFSIK